MNIPRECLYIVLKLIERGHTAFVVGGAVRDALLGLPSDDFDIATTAVPEEIISLFPNAVPVGMKFGVMIVPVKDQSFEVATFRTEWGYSDSRHPDHVAFSNPKEDADRRDFTINALFYDVQKKDIVDFVGGRSDLESRTLRTVGDPHARFQEDPLRLLRAIRFKYRLDLHVEEATDRAIAENAHRLSLLSAERVRDELTKIITGPRAGDAVRELSDKGLLAHWLPEIDLLKGVEQPIEWHPEGDVFVHTLLALSNLQSPWRETPSCAWGVLLHDIGKPKSMTRTPKISFKNHASIGSAMARAVVERLKFDRKTQDEVVESVTHHMTFREHKAMRKSTLKKLLAHPSIDILLEVSRADGSASNGGTDSYYVCRDYICEWSKTNTLNPTPLLNGNDIKALGVTEGRRIGELLHTVREKQLDEDIRSRNEALEFVRHLLEKN